jgi:catechol 2,3-dioxygenase-like lactoylglutathione lyase family enzyme
MGIHHLDLVVSDLERSLSFYTELLQPLGYTGRSEITGERGERVVYLGHTAQIGLRERQADTHHDRYALGVHHIAFAASSREQVDERARWLADHGVAIDTEPREYDYADTYYAVFFYDPDGLKLEIAYAP